MSSDSIPQNNGFSYAQNYIRGCLAGKQSEAPKLENAPSHIHDVLKLLYQANQMGGVEAAQREWEKMITVEPKLGELKLIGQRKIYQVNRLQELPSLSYLLEEIIPHRSFVVFYGPSGGGKSFIALRWAFAIARNAPVVYLSAEGETGYKMRVNAHAKYLGTDLPDSLLHVTFEGLNLMDLDETRRFIEEIRHLNPKLVIIDTLARSMIGDENQAEDMGQFIRGCDLIKENLGATVMVIHHTGKSGNSFRGSSALEGAADVMISLKNSGGNIEMVCEKTKDAREFDTRYYRLEVVELDNGDSSCVAVRTNRNKKAEKESLDKPQRQILEMLEMSIFKATGAKARNISEFTGIGASTTYRRLDQLKVAGLVRQSAEGDPYFITELGSTAIQSIEEADENLADLL